MKSERLSGLKRALFWLTLGVHPDVRGHRFYADRIASRLSVLMSVPSAAETAPLSKK